jgi:hypothetical protein
MSVTGNQSLRHNRLAWVRMLPVFTLSVAACTGGMQTGKGDGAPNTDDSPSVEQIEQAVREGCAPGSFAGKIARAGTDQVDLLVVVDRSKSMREELDSLSRELPKVAQALTSGDLDGDGESDIMPVQSLRVAITSNDIGAEQVGIPTCKRPGDGANLFKAPSGKRYFEYEAGASEESFGGLGELFLELGADGCGFEQPFEATLAALSGEAPYADLSDAWPAPEATDFLRERSVLAVLLVTDEDDCSALPPQALFVPNTHDPRFGDQGLNLRCALNADDSELLRPVDEFVTRLKAMRSDIPSRLIFGAFAGAPVGTTKTPEELLSDPALQLRIDGDPASDISLPAPACQTETTYAMPPRRIVQAAAAFGAQGVVQSICDEDLATPLTKAMLTLAESFEPLPACD